jgi:mono/diheme cytochrome c family protein
MYTLRRRNGRRRSSPQVLLACVLAAAFVAACADETLEDAPCPERGTTLTYENFGRAFFARYCVECHGRGSSSSRAYTSVERIREERGRIFVNAAASNTTMPPGPDDPPRAERDALAEWLACGAP